MNTLPKLRPAPAPMTPAALLPKAESPSYSGYDSSCNSVADEEMIAAPVKTKKRRLDHLSWEEKVQRKKLKNRVAAQTSRDRKKARMEEMEIEIKELTEKTEILQNKCMSLQCINESLLAKNQKLDMEMEQMRQELAEMKQLAKGNSLSAIVGAEGCASTLTGSAAGFTSGHTVVSACHGIEAEPEQHHSLAMENCGSLPSIQDMLLVDDEEFDARRLEELAESLLADIAADLETGTEACEPDATKDEGITERLPRPVVGTAAERLESHGHRADGLNSNTKNMQTTVQHRSSPRKQVSQINENQQKKASATNIVMKPPTTKTKIISAAAFIQAPTPDTVYGTYDAKTNSITIVMDDDTEPINEAVEIIYGDGVSACDDSTEAMCPPRATSPTEVFLSVINATDESDDETTSHLNFEPMESFLSPRVKAISPLAKSPALSMHSAISDHGYESIMGSPASTTLTHLDSDVNMPASEEDEFLWESNFDELFPSLI